MWSRIYVPEGNNYELALQCLVVCHVVGICQSLLSPTGVSYTLRNLQHTPAVLSYIVIKPDREANRERDPSREGEDD